jgi:hypothetical protein
MDHSSTPPRAHLPIEHELTDAHASPVVKFLVFLVVTSIAVAGLMVLFYNHLEEREAREKTARYPLGAGVARPLPPPPRLQTYPFGDIKDLRQEQNRLLDRYEWVDKSSGVVRIPIDRAMEVLAERGLPYRQPAPAAGAAPSTSGGSGAAVPTGAASGSPPVTPAAPK